MLPTITCDVTVIGFLKSDFKHPNSMLVSYFSLASLAYAKV